MLPCDFPDPCQHTRGVLLAVLANPTPRPFTRTEQQIAVAADVLGYHRVQIANLFALASVSSREIRTLGTEEVGWQTARNSIEDALPQADGVLVAFGSIPTSGPSRTHLRTQLAWLSARLRDLSDTDVWQVGVARHPSRWHQYVSDVHARTSGGDFVTRLTQVLQPVSPVDRTWTA